MRTKKEIKEKIKEVSEERKTIREFSVFGDPNWKTMDAELEILKANLSEDEVGEALERMTDYYDGDFPKESVEKSKMDTYDWLLGNRD